MTSITGEYLMNRGFGFVTLPSMEIAEEVMKSSDGQDLMVRKSSAPFKYICSF